MKILITGSEGFIGQYLVKEAIKTGHIVLGIDNLSKYGKATGFDHPNYKFYKTDVCNLDKMFEIVAQFHPNQMIINAAKIGGIHYFHKYAYDIIAQNEQILAASFHIAIALYKTKIIPKVTVLSSSMIYESADIFPLTEEMIYQIPPPKSTYGFQKLAVHYFCKGAYEQYGLPYTIIIPFNAVGIGETDFETGESHVIPDLIYRLLMQGPTQPLKILGSGKQIRHYTYAKDLAQNIIKSLTMLECINQEINISTERSTSVIELVEILWDKIHGHHEILIEPKSPLPYDVQKRIPSVEKAKKLELTCNTKLETVLDEVIKWIRLYLNKYTL